MVRPEVKGSSFVNSSLSGSGSFGTSIGGLGRRASRENRMRAGVGVKVLGSADAGFLEEGRRDDQIDFLAEAGVEEEEAAVRNSCLRFAKVSFPGVGIGRGGSMGRRTKGSRHRRLVLKSDGLGER